MPAMVRKIARHMWITKVVNLSTNFKLGLISTFSSLRVRYFKALEKYIDLAIYSTSFEANFFTSSGSTYS